MKWDEMKWNEMNKLDMGDIKGGVTSKDTYGKPYNSWRLRGEKIVQNFMHLNSSESALHSVQWIFFTENELFKWSITKIAFLAYSRVFAIFHTVISLKFIEKKIIDVLWLIEIITKDNN